MLRRVIEKFKDLSDVDHDYAGDAGKAVIVKAAEDGLEFVATVPPSTHKASHENGGADEIDVAGLSGELADDQPPKTHDHDGVILQHDGMDSDGGAFPFKTIGPVTHNQDVVLSSGKKLIFDG